MQGILQLMCFLPCLLDSVPLAPAPPSLSPIAPVPASLSIFSCSCSFFPVCLLLFLLILFPYHSSLFLFSLFSHASFPSPFFLPHLPPMSFFLSLLQTSFLPLLRPPSCTHLFGLQLLLSLFIVYSSSVDRSLSKVLSHLPTDHKKSSNSNP